MTVFRRGKVFYYDFILHGVRFAATTRKKNRREAEKVEAKARRKEEGHINAAQGSPGGPSLLTFGDAMDRLYKERWSRTRDHARTLARINRLIELLGKDTPLSSIDNARINQLGTQLRAMNLKEPTLNRYFATMKTLLITAQREWGTIATIPYIKLAKEPTGRLRTFTVAEETKIQELLRNEATVRGKVVTKLSTEAADLFILLADTGMRLGEGIKLESRDVNMETGLIHIWMNKADKPRSVPMTARVRAMLEPRMDSSSSTGRESAGGTPANGRIFRFTDGQEVEGVWRRRIKKQPEFADAVVHSYRHSYASRLVQLGVPLFTLQKLMGHSTSKMTERYSHLAPEHFRESAMLLDSLVNGNAIVTRTPVVK
jgi:integrase